MADVPHAWPAYMLPEQKTSHLQALADNKLAISNINSFMMHAIDDPRQKYWHPSWIEPDRHYRQIRIEHTKRALTWRRNSERRASPRAGRTGRTGAIVEIGIATVCRDAQAVAEHAEKLGVLLLVEPEPGLLIETVDQFLEFMQHIQSPAVGMNFDIGHAYCVKDDPAASIPRCAKFIRHFHLEDIAATRVHQHLVPGEGAIDSRGALTAIRAMNYQGWITIELYPYIQDPDVAARTALERVRKLLPSNERV